MQIKKILAIFIIFIFILSSAAMAVDAPETKAEGALLMDLESGETLYEKNINQKLYPASLTKIMTFLVIMDIDPDLNEVITVEEYMLEGLSEFGSSANIKPTEQLTVKELLECMLISSANEAGNILAIHCFGSVEAFVVAMNSKADALGCNDTHFMNPHGLHDEGHFTTVSDMRLIAVEALKSDLFVEITSSDIITQKPTNLRQKGRMLVNTNNLLTKYRTADYFYRDAQGVKTGFTTPAGNCLVATAKRGEFYLLSVVMNAPQDPETKVIASYTDTIALFDWGFDNFAKKTLITSTEPVLELPVTLSEDNDYVVLAPANDITAIVPKDLEPENIERVIEAPAAAEAPIYEGEPYGKLTLRSGGRDYGEVDLIALSGAERSAFLEFLKNAKDALSNPSVVKGIFIAVGIILSYTALMIIVNLARKRKKERLLARKEKSGGREKTSKELQSSENEK